MKRRLRFSLLTLLLSTLLLGSGVALWLHWEPWYRHLTLTDGRTSVLFAAFTIDESKLVWLDDGLNTHVIDVNTGVEIVTDSIRLTEVRALGMSGGRPIAVTMDEQIRGPSRPQQVILDLEFSASIIDLETGYPITTLGTGVEPIRAMALSPDGRHLLLVRGDATAQVWLLNGGLPAGTLHTGAFRIHEAALANGGKRIAATGQSGSLIAAWELSGARILEAYGESIPLSLGVSPDGSRALFSFGDRAAEVWDLNSGALLQHFTSDHVRYGEEMAPIFTADSSRAMVINNENTCLLELAEGRELARFELACAACFSADGRAAVCLRTGAEVRSADDGRLLAALPFFRRVEQLWKSPPIAAPPMAVNVNPPQIPPPSFSADGRTLIASYGTSLGVWMRRRPEAWWGILFLAPFWTTLTLALALIGSLRRDRLR